MRALVSAVLIAVLASPAHADCMTSGVGTLPEQIANQTAVVICQQQELKQQADLKAMQLQIEAQLQAQRIMLEEELKLEQQQQLATLNPPFTP